MSSCLSKRQLGFSLVSCKQLHVPGLFVPFHMSFQMSFRVFLCLFVSFHMSFHMFFRVFFASLRVFSCLFEKTTWF